MHPLPILCNYLHSEKKDYLNHTEIDHSGLLHGISIKKSQYTKDLL